MDARILLVTADGTVRLHTLPLTGRVLVGRDPDCDLVLDHDKISRRHVELTLTNNAATITDLESSNGTLLAGRKLRAGKATPMRPGERAEIGPFALVLLPAGAPAAVAPSLRVEDPAAPSEIVAAVARAPVTILIHAEPSRKRDALLAGLHSLSGRAGPLVKVTCQVAPLKLERELFGEAQPGFLEAAKGGTIFLDEIGAAPLAVQAKLVRAIEAHETVRLGTVKAVPIDVRFIAATAKDLVNDPLFRKDLYYKLAGMTLTVGRQR
jgi:predicted component of type VI protein secretion system